MNDWSFNGGVPPKFWFGQQVLQRFLYKADNPEQHKLLSTTHKHLKEGCPLYTGFPLVLPSPQGGWLRSPNSPAPVGKVYGLEWRTSKEFLFSETGWHYWIRWDSGRDQAIHEKELEALT